MQCAITKNSFLLVFYSYVFVCYSYVLVWCFSYDRRHTTLLMNKAVLLPRLEMTQDSIRNTHTQMLWEKEFRGETLPVLVTKYGQNVIPKTHATLH